MKVPNRIECAYCIRHHTHGGECTGKKSNSDEVGCLIFKADIRGCIRNSDFRLPVPLYGNIPPQKCWITEYSMNDLETEIKINYIKALSWERSKGYLFIHCNCDYYINEYHENYKETVNKPIFTVVK